MYERFKHFIYFILFILLFLPPVYLFLSVFLPSLKIADLSSLRDYIFISFDARVMLLFIRTLSVGVFTSIVSGIIGLILAIIFECSDIAHKNIFRFLLFLPFLVPPYLFTFSWLASLGKRGSLAGITLPNIPINIYNPLALIGLLSLSFFPLPMFIISLGLRNMDRNIIDAARLLGGRRLMRRILLPLIWPHVFVSCIFVFSLSVSEYTVPSFLRVNTYSDEVFAQLAAFYDIRRAMVYSLPLVLVSTIITILASYYFRKLSFVTISGSSRKGVNFITLSKHQKLLAYSFIALITLLALLVPMGMMLIESELSFFNAIILARKSIVNSILIGGISALIITTLGFLTHYSLKKTRLLASIITFPLVVASPVMGISLINLYDGLPIPVYGTPIILTLGYSLRFLPFSIFIFSAFCSQISPSVEESCRVCAIGFFNSLWKIIFPLVKGGFVSSLILIFIFCLGEVGVTQMVAPPGFQTLSMRIETLMHYGNYRYVSSLSLFMLTFIFLLYGLYGWVYREYG